MLNTRMNKKRSNKNNKSNKNMIAKEKLMESQN